MDKYEILSAQERYIFPSVFHYYREPLVIDHAKGHYVHDIDGRTYLDFFGGIVTVSVGHCNEAVNQQVEIQMKKLQHVSTLFVTEPQVSLAKKLSEITPNGALTKSFFTNSGTEANETAILAARCYTGNTEVIALRHSYHGRSVLAMSLTAQAPWKLGGTMSPGVVHAVNAYCYRCPFGLRYPDCGVRCAHDLRETIRTTTSGRIAAFIAEPIQGVGGFITPPREYFKITVEIVKEYGGIFISDEVQTAWGRTGQKWFGIEHWGVEPDIITGAKGLGNGAPIGVTIAKPDIADSLKGLTISTFGGNPVTTTQAKAVLDYIETHKLRHNAEVVGAYLHDKLLALQEKYPIIGDVRGMGLLRALELVRDRTTKEPATKETNAVLERARENGILIGKGGLHSNVLRISPPMTVGKSEVDDFVKALDQSLDGIV